MSTLFMIFYTFWMISVYPLGNAIAERPRDWRLLTSLAGMFGAAIVAIFMQ